MLDSAVVDSPELLARLVELAREAGLEIRSVASAEGAPASSSCRVHGALWVVLSGADSLDVQIDVLAEALRAHAGARLEDRYLPPAVRARLAGP